MSARPRSVDTVIVGAGHAGLIVSGLLRQLGREHVLLDRRSTLGGGWQDRWDAFQLVSPNWTTSLDGFAYRGADPDGFMPRDEIVDHFRAYAATIDAPVELDTDVTHLELYADGASRFRLATSRGSLEARSVVVAGGPFQAPHRPPAATLIDPSISQVHVHHYRNPSALPPGGVLLVGSGQSGVQLAEELMAAGRSVTMAVGRCGRVPRTYRGKDVFWWLREMGTRGLAVGLGLPTPAQLPDPRARFACNPQLSGHGGGHDTNLRAMARDGLRLVGRLTGADGTRVSFAPDLPDSLRFADGFFEARFRPVCDAYVERMSLALPPDEPAQVAFDPPVVTELDLAAEGISTVLWTSGYRPSFEWVEAPVFDELGLPVTDAGQTTVPGLSFIGTPWMVDMGSANLVGVERDAKALVSRL
ncbi:MAG: NAD(P)-binding domain-containing protein [Chloroflexi bacterium]|nr:NAD(P)-binding domain-containing protein [Chloroflexota bacterium]